MHYTLYRQLAGQPLVVSQQLSTPFPRQEIFPFIVRKKKREKLKFQNPIRQTNSLQKPSSPPTLPPTTHIKAIPTVKIIVGSVAYRKPPWRMSASSHATGTGFAWCARRGPPPRRPSRAIHVPLPGTSTASPPAPKP